LKFLQAFGALLFFCMVCHFSITWSAKQASYEEIKRLVAENERLRSFNARRQRRLKWMNQPESIDLESVSLAYHVTGVKPSWIAALLYCENGPEDLKTGSIDKTDVFAKYFKVKDWSALDGTRTLTRSAFEWFSSTEEGREAAKQFLLYAAAPYTNLSAKEQQAWMRNMVKAERKFKSQITISGKEEKSVSYVMKTPTPIPAR